MILQWAVTWLQIAYELGVERKKKKKTLLMYILLLKTPIGFLGPVGTGGNGSNKMTTFNHLPTSEFRDLAFETHSYRVFSFFVL